MPCHPVLESISVLKSFHKKRPVSAMSNDELADEYFCLCERINDLLFELANVERRDGGDREAEALKQSVRWGGVFIAGIALPACFYDFWVGFTVSLAGLGLTFYALAVDSAEDYNRKVKVSIVRLAKERVDTLEREISARAT